MSNSMARRVTVGSWLADKDYGEFFLNFQLNHDLRKCYGVDLTQFFLNIGDSEAYMVVCVRLQCTKGLHSSLYNVI